MQLARMNWMQVEAYLQQDDRAVIPMGSVEQHGYLSLGTDTILAERVAQEAAEPLGVPVLPALAYGITPTFTAFPGTVSLRTDTAARLLRDVLDGLANAGFRRLLIVNGHGGNAPLQAVAAEWMSERPGCSARLHNWWIAPQTWQRVQAFDPVALHASWMENFPWTRVPGVSLPDVAKEPLDVTYLRSLSPAPARAYLGDGNFGGRYARPDDELLAIWQTAVDETRAAIQGPWPPAPR